MLVGDEVAPRILEASRPDFVVWSSLWPDRRGDQIRFDLTPAKHSGTMLTWTLTTPGAEPDAASLRNMRFRLNFLINSELRNQHFDL